MQNKAANSLIGLYHDKLRSEATTKKLADAPTRLFCVLGEAEITLRELMSAMIDHPTATKEHMRALFHALERLKVRHVSNTMIYIL
jgi:hypothetical protein